MAGGVFRFYSVHNCMQNFNEWLVENGYMEAVEAGNVTAKLRLSGLLKRGRRLDTTDMGAMFDLFHKVTGKIATRVADMRDPQFFDKLHNACCTNIFGYQPPDDPEGIIAAWIKRNPSEWD